MAVRRTNATSTLTGGGRTDELESHRRLQSSPHEFSAASIQSASPFRCRRPRNFSMGWWDTVIDHDPNMELALGFVPDVTAGARDMWGLEEQIAPDSSSSLSGSLGLFRCSCRWRPGCRSRTNWLMKWGCCFTELVRVIIFVALVILSGKDVKMPPAGNTC
ncbi:uncharacterized protein SEPMUDRAFT_133676 [Sphaerulina musiva SO2202]|uniref:Uncharacterized protein n=1 Tax=Sphaerulina musiva (strain SO2202) TaxID=692275 RepID=N1QET7_SPHMS|nr:uncharacterized protein SEPMUDRAFT_133676 [Sphaerulina musiva SO2202]EMF11663.1 hypothetical protein SEPMUDRAFT_133676 [Sphaerulina musiva SO2202]